MASDFRINLYRKRPVVDLYGVVEPKYVNEREIFYDAKDGAKVGTDGVISSETMTEEEKLISVIRGNGEITQKQMSQKTGLPPPFYIFLHGKDFVVYNTDFNGLGNPAELVRKLEMNADIAVFVNLDMVYQLNQNFTGQRFNA